MSPDRRTTVLLGLGFLAGTLLASIGGLPPWGRRALAEGTPGALDGLRYQISSWAHGGGGASPNSGHGAYVIDTSSGQVFSIDASDRVTAIGRVPAIAGKSSGEPKPGREASVKTPHEKLIGTWKMVSARYGGQDFQFPEGVTVIKHVTLTHFTTIIHDKEGKVLRAAGGSCDLAGELYRETPEYGTSENFDNIKGKPQEFDCKVDEQTWHHEGKLSNNLLIEEVYERVR